MQSRALYFVFACGVLDVMGDLGRMITFLPLAIIVLGIIWLGYQNTLETNTNELIRKKNAEHWANKHPELVQYWAFQLDWYKRQALKRLECKRQ